MKRYLAVYLGTPEGLERAGWNQLTDTERKEREREGVAAWTEWVESNRAHIVESGSPLGKTKRISARGVEDVRNEMAAWVVVQAESHAAAASLFEQHPHFTLFPGDAVEVMECLPLPVI